MSESDYSILTRALEIIRDPFVNPQDLELAAKSIFVMLQTRDDDPDVQDCQNAVGKSGALVELFNIYRRRSNSEYVTLCLTWALFRNPHNSDILGQMEGFGPVIKTVITDPSVSSRKKSHALDLWDNVVNNLSKFEPHILEVVPAFVHLIEHDPSMKTKGRCINSARISSYRVETREKLRQTNVVDLLIKAMWSGKPDLAPHAACQAVANLVGDYPNHPALASASHCTGSLLNCFSRALQDLDYPESTNTFPNDFFVCMGLANLANSDAMKRMLFNEGLLPMLEVAAAKTSCKCENKLACPCATRLTKEVYKCLGRLIKLSDIAIALSKCNDLMTRLKFHREHATDRNVRKVAGEICFTVEKAISEEAAKIEQRAKIRSSKLPIVAEVSLTEAGVNNLSKKLLQEGYSLAMYPGSDALPKRNKLMKRVRYGLTKFDGAQLKNSVPDNQLAFVAVQKGKLLKTAGRVPVDDASKVCRLTTDMIMPARSDINDIFEDVLQNSEVLTGTKRNEDSMDVDEVDHINEFFSCGRPLGSQIQSFLGTLVDSHRP